MDHEKKYSCPTCKSYHTIRKGVRRGKVKYQCRACNKWFQINRGHKQTVDKKLTLLHLDGVSFRSLSDQFHMSVGSIYAQVSNHLDSLPHVADITRKYCNKFSGILLVDGKYVKVKGYERKIPVIYGIDYTTHDIPSFQFTIAENYQSCLSFFTSLKLLGYPLLSVVCDENVNIFEAARYIYPSAVIQLCQNHYKQNIRKTLDLSLNPQHLPFMRKIEDLFVFKRSTDDFNRAAKNIFNQHKTNPICAQIMVDMYRNRELLLGWRGGHHIPTTTNLIECFNSHLQGRLKTIKGFETFKHANKWLNGYFLRRRLKKFTGCEGRFRFLNGKTSISQTIKDSAKIPELMRLFR